MTPRSNSGDTTIVHSTTVLDPKQRAHSAEGMVRHSTQVHEDPDLSLYTWYWGVTSRQDCEMMLQEKGVVGNFVVRMNDRGDYIMSFW